MIKVKNQYTVSELGKRSNNEDNFGYVHGSTFVVCDGVGGSNMGEVASEITVKTYIEEFHKNPDADANDVLKLAEANITKHVSKNPNVAGMATTLSFSQIRKNGIYIAWVGDSRVYQFRSGEIIFQTTDHSWVNEALRSGILTPSEAINHPKSNIITRAIQGEQKPTRTENCLLTNIKKGDMFLHCTDGVLESWSNEDLSALFVSLKNPALIIEKIKLECLQNSKDNFTAIIYEIEDAKLSDSQNTQQVNKFESSLIKKEKCSFDEREVSTKSNTKKVFVFVTLLLFLIIPTTIYLTSIYLTTKNQTTKESKSKEIKIEETSIKTIKNSTISPTTSQEPVSSPNPPNPLKEKEKQEGTKPIDNKQHENPVKTNPAQPVPPPLPNSPKNKKSNNSQTRGRSIVIL